MNSKSSGRGLEGFLAGKGFYIVLFLCAAAIGLSAWMAAAGSEAAENVRPGGDVSLEKRRVETIIITPAPAMAPDRVETMAVPDVAEETVAGAAEEEQETMAELEELAAESPFFADYLAKMKRLPILDEEEEDALYQKACEGDEKAREKLLESRLPMVAEAALLYRDQGSRMEDLMQEGSLGLILGLETAMAEEASDWRKTVLTTVMETLEQAVYEDNAQVSVARKSVERAQSVRDAAKSFETEFGYEASKEALAGYLEMEAEELESILKLGADEKDFLSGRQEEDDNEQ